MNQKTNCKTDNSTNLENILTSKTIDSSINNSSNKNI